MVDVHIGGSHGNLATSVDGYFLSDQELKSDRRSYTLSETDDEEYLKFRGLTKEETIANSGSTGLTVIVDPPSPPHKVQKEETAEEPKPAHDAVRRLSENCRRCEYILFENK